MKSGTTIDRKPDGTEGVQCRNERSKQVDSSFKRVKTIISKNIKAQTALSALHSAWMEAMLGVVPKGRISLSEYAEKASDNRQRVTELGDKLVVAYCKQSMECASSIMN